VIDLQNLFRHQSEQVILFQNHLHHNVIINEQNIKISLQKILNYDLNVQKRENVRSVNHSQTAAQIGEISMESLHSQGLSSEIAEIDLQKIRSRVLIVQKCRIVNQNDEQAKDPFAGMQMKSLQDLFLRQNDPIIRFQSRISLSVTANDLFLPSVLPAET